VTAFIWLAGRPSLDLCNTRLGARELLEGPDDLARWLAEAGLAEAGPEVDEHDLGAVLSLRDDMRAALLSADSPGVAALASSWLDGVRARVYVESGTLSPRIAPEGCDCRCLMMMPVLDALDLARDASGRVRECASERCRAVYLDTSRNRSRRWCSMQRCGARAKAAAYYRRHRGEAVA
jgi:predicted RNA-binding Zn ribbon-like protein